MWRHYFYLLLARNKVQKQSLDRYTFRRCSGQIHSFQSAPENRATILGCLLVLQIYQQKRSQEESRVKYFNSPFSSRKTLDNLLSFRFSAAASVCFLPFPVISFLLRIRFQLTKVCLLFGLEQNWDYLIGQKKRTFWGENNFVY